MRTDEVIRHFVTQKGVADALGMSQPSVALWREYPPPARQLQLEMLTGGALKAEPGCLERVVGFDKLKAKAGA